jgi:ubiquinone/menaquinone biosynthesis methyltransferase
MNIPLTEKARVPGEFDRVAARYDLLTALNPGYTKHLGWSARRLALASDARILDLCCGTGLSTAALVSAYPHATIDGVDASDGMLAVARRKNLGPRVQFSLGNAMDLAGSGVSGPYDGVLMAYGIRNMPDPDLALRGIREVLRPGGAICFHEYSVADSLRSRALWRAVANAIIVPSGRLFSGSADIYRYLRQSVLDFDGVTAFERRLRAAGFTDVRTEPMDGWQLGIVHSFLARRPLS